MKENNTMKTRYIIETTAELDNDGNTRQVHAVYRVREGEKPEPISSHSTFGEALSVVTLLNEKARIAAAELDDLTKDQTGRSELDDFLNDHSELAQALGAAAREYAEKKRQDEALKLRRRELSEAIAEFDKAICVAQRAINTLKGDMLRIQKERKAAVAELASVGGIGK